MQLGMRIERIRSLLILLVVLLATLPRGVCAAAEPETAAGGATTAFSTPADAHATVAPRKLMAPSRPIRRDAAPEANGDRKTARSPLANATPDVKTVAASLALVLALFFAAAWMMKKGMPKSAGVLPGEVVQVMGRAQLSGKQYVHLVRCGQKLLLVNITPGGAETLTEITDPLEVDRLLGICAQQNPNSATAAFRDVLQQLGRERTHA